jgi:hypothetical protein
MASLRLRDGTLIKVPELSGTSAKMRPRVKKISDALGLKLPSPSHDHRGE